MRFSHIILPSVLNFTLLFMLSNTRFVRYDTQGAYRRVLNFAARLEAP